MNEIVEDFNISLIEDGKIPKIIESHVGDIKAFIEFQKAKGVDFNGTLQRFYVTSYKVFQVDKILFYIQNQNKVGKRNEKLSSLATLILIVMKSLIN
jgi:hypothetical protein